jgi:hypothetical protein
MIQGNNANTAVLDVDSVITGYGKHDRVVCFLPDDSGLEMRVDCIHGLGLPTSEQLLTVAKLDQNVKGKWRLVDQVMVNPVWINQAEFTRVYYTFEKM